MERKLPSIARAFVTGGGIALVVQVVNAGVTMVLPEGAPLALRCAIALDLTGVLTIFLVQSGIYDKLTEFGGMGANLPFIGIVPAVTGAMAGARAHGASTGGAVAAGLKLMAILFGTSFAVCIVIALVSRALGVGIYA